ncbi:MAG TPA: alpha/beta fold hydrolase [Blastocatellia bacterium]|nr:alpha/beta fold hydrolase [Blastocatellia bacterium]
MKKEIAELYSRSPFVPHPALWNPHAQTIVSSVLRRPRARLSRQSEPRYFDVALGVRVLAHCSWQADRQRRQTVLILHGLEGSAESPYMLGTAEKALRAGFNALRINHRNCGGTEDLTPTLYHAGLTDDVRQIICELIERDGLREICLVGFSLGGNIALKLAGELGPRAPKELKKVVAVSPSLDLMSCADAIEMRSNIIYHMSFLSSLRGRMRRKARLFPDRYDGSRLRGIRTIRQFDSIYTAPHSGFRDVTDYYERASALPHLKHIALPTMIIQARDDPFIPFAPFERPEIASNPHIGLVATRHGGHVGFIAASVEEGDRFWAESRAIEFLRLPLKSADSAL